MSDLALKLRIELDAAQGTTALKRFESAFDETLRKLGKSPAEIAAIKQIARDVNAGKVKLNELDDEAQRLQKTLSQGKANATFLGDLGLDKSHAQITAEIERVKTSYAQLKASGTFTHAELTQAAALTRNKIDELKTSMTGTNTASSGMASGLGAVRSVVAAVSAAIAGSMILKYADEMQLLRGRLLLVEGSHAGVNRAMKEIARIALATNTDIGAVGDSYIRFATAIQKVGGTSQQALRFTEAVARSLKLSGASAEEASSTMRQLGQSLMKGKLQGDEFVSVAESGGLLLDYLAKAMGKTRGELIQMSAEGKITTKELLKLGDSLEKIRKDSANLPQTVGAAMTNVATAFKLWTDQSALVKSSSAGVITALDSLAKHFNIIAGVAAGLTFAATSLGLASLIGRLSVIIPLVVRFVLGLNPWVRAAMIIGSVAATFSDQIRDMWHALTYSTADKAVASLEELQGALKKAGEEIRGQMGAGMEAAKARIDSLGKAYKTASDMVKQAMADKIAAIQRAAEAEKQANETAGDISQAQRIAEEVRITRDAGAQKLAAIREFGQQQLADSSETYRRLTELARISGQDVKAVEQEGLKARIDIYRQIEDAYRATIDHLIAEEHRHLGEVRRIEDERARLKMSTEDRIRDLARTAMDESRAYADRLMQVDQKQAAAKAELARGNFDKAKALADEASRLAEQSAREVKMPGADGRMEVVVSQARAASKAIGEIRESASIADQALAGLAGAHQKAADAAKTGATEAKIALKEIDTQLDALKEKASAGATLQLKAEFSEADSLIANFKQQLENEKFIARVEADMAKAKADIDAWLMNPENVELKMQADLATDNAIKQMDALKTEAASRKIPLDVDFAEARTLLGYLQTELRAPTQSKHTVAADIMEAWAKIRGLEQPTSSTHTVYVRQVEQRALGGLVGAVQALATGGQVFRRAAGQIFGPGSGTSDQVPVMASHGEFIVKAASVRQYGVNFLNTINRGLFPSTDITHAIAAAAPSHASAPSGNEMKLTIQGPRGETVRVTSERDEAMKLVRLLKSAGVSFA